MLNLSTDLSINIDFTATTSDVQAISERGRAAFSAVLGNGAVGAAIHKSALPSFLCRLDLADAGVQS